eukprot:tig00000658_g2911.t1
MSSGATREFPHGFVFTGTAFGVRENFEGILRTLYAEYVHVIGHVGDSRIDWEALKSPEWENDALSPALMWDAVTTQKNAAPVMKLRGKAQSPDEAHLLAKPPRPQEPLALPAQPLPGPFEPQPAPQLAGPSQPNAPRKGKGRPPTPPKGAEEAGYDEHVRDASRVYQNPTAREAYTALWEKTYAEATHQLDAKKRAQYTTDTLRASLLRQLDQATARSSYGGHGAGTYAMAPAWGWARLPPRPRRRALPSR